jgi:hypothetical protein
VERGEKRFIPKFVIPNPAGLTAETQSLKRFIRGAFSGRSGE